MTAPTRPPAGMLLVKIEIQIPGKWRKRSVFRMIPNNLLEDTLGNEFRFRRAKQIIGEAFEEVYKDTVNTIPEATQPPRSHKNGRKS